MSKSVSAKRSGADLIAAERQRQIDVEGWTPGHDDEHGDGELALAAVCYATPQPLFVRSGDLGTMVFADPWPDTWDEEWDKRVPRPSPRQRIRMLVKAGALIGAEIDRLTRAAPDRQASPEKQSPRPAGEDGRDE